MTTNKDRIETEREEAAGLVPAAVMGGELDVIAARLVDQARAEGISLTGDGGLLPALLGRVLSSGLSAEMTEHLGYERHAVEGHHSGNSRNGSYPKTVTTEIGQVEVAMPRDRSATFDPVLVPKGERRLDGLSGQVISLYGKGLTTGEIRAHLEDIYDTSISKDTISRITDTIVADMESWQSRPLDSIYAVVLIDAIVIKVRDTQVANRPVYVAIGVNMDGERDVLGLWMGPSGGEGAKQWMTMLTELRNRGVLDVLITCCDGLKGLPDAVRTVWPDTTVQTCVVHLVRIDRPSRVGSSGQSFSVFRLTRRMCCSRAETTRLWRAVSSVQPLSCASSRSEMTSSSWAARTSRRRGSGTKLSHCSQILA